MNTVETSGNSSTAVQLEEKVALVKVGAQITLASRNPEVSLSRHIDWDLRCLMAEDYDHLPCSSAVLVYRGCDKLDHLQTENPNRVRADLALYFSLHPIRSDLPDRRLLELEIQECVKFALEERASKIGMTCSCSSLWVQFDLGLVYHSDEIVGSHVQDGSNILLGVCYDWDLKTCWLTGEHFYPPAPLGFFYQGDGKKPVAPDVARRRGFTISTELLLGISSRLNTADNLVSLPAEIRGSENHLNSWEDTQLARCQYPAMSWGGQINTLYKTRPDIMPGEITRARNAAESVNYPERVEPFESPELERPRAEFAFQISRQQQI